MLIYLPILFFVVCACFGYFIGYLVYYYKNTDVVPVPEQAAHLMIFVLGLILVIITLGTGVHELRYKPMSTKTPAQMDTIRTIKTGFEPDTTYVYTFDKEVSK